MKAINVQVLQPIMTVEITVPEEFQVGVLKLTDDDKMFVRALLLM
jgi:hypothetical protein